MTRAEVRFYARDLGWALLWCACPPALTVYGFWVVWRMTRSGR